MHLLKLLMGPREIRLILRRLPVSMYPPQMLLFALLLLLIYLIGQILK